MDRLIRRFNDWHLSMKPLQYNLVLVALLASFFIPLMVGASTGNGWFLIGGFIAWAGVWMIGVGRIQK